jgi:2-methylcitrate dehydratase PrpD
MTVLDRLGAWVAGAHPTPPRLGLHVLDTVGAYLAGSRTEEAALLRRLTGGAVPSLTDAVPDRVALRVACTRLSEIDDIHLPSCVTPGSIVVPTALTMAASLQAAPRDLADALLAGYGVMTWLGRALEGPNIIYRGIWPTYLLAPVGAAAVTARLLGLKPQPCVNALAMALTMVSGGPGNPSGHAPRWLLAGLAARAGVLAALAASQHFSGDATLLDGDWLHRIHGIQPDTIALGLPLPEDGNIGELSMKPVCAAKQTIAAITAITDLIADGLEPERIEQVRILVPPPYAAMVGHHQTAHRTGRMTSAPYQVAVACYAPESFLDLERPDLTSFPPVAHVLERTQVAIDEGLAEHYPTRWPARLDVRLQDGAQIERLVIDARGDPDRPLTQQEVVAKFAQLAPDAAIPAQSCIDAVSREAALRALCQAIETPLETPQH